MKPNVARVSQRMSSRGSASESGADGGARSSVLPVRPGLRRASDGSSVMPALAKSAVNSRRRAATNDGLAVATAMRPPTVERNVIDALDSNGAAIQSL